MSNTREYNPLNEGYTGYAEDGYSAKKGYTGNNSSSSNAPTTLPPIHTAINKPVSQQKDNNSSKK